MKRPGKREKEQEIDLLAALRFVSVAQTAEGKSPYMMHCAFRENEVVAFNGILTAGFPVIESLAGCPHTFKLIAALSQVRGAYSMVLLDTLQLSVRSDRFSALVPCIKAEMIDQVRGDGPNIYPLGNSFKNAAEMAGAYCTDGATTVVGAAILTQQWSLMGSNGTSGFIEALTGWEMPSGLVIPKSFVNAAAKINMDISGFSFSEGSFTLYFENGAWLKTQLYQESYPKIERASDFMNNATPVAIPAELWTAIAAVAPHSPNKQLFFANNQVRSHPTKIEGAQHECDGLPFVCALSLKVLLPVRDMMVKADWTTHNDMVVFYGDQVRGLLMKIKWNGEV
jgi:hypothetical protein